MTKRVSLFFLLLVGVWTVDGRSTETAPSAPIEVKTWSTANPEGWTAEDESNLRVDMFLSTFSHHTPEEEARFERQRKHLEAVIKYNTLQGLGSDETD